ncbi:MAG TPA: MotA/TolQ/ExbB proton channel family protein [Candidatus Omnitrophota bacterium]|nr:MotA/TolQ/ExbB proton channel family protein [Candidatus Omnitrophota bacterium]
MSGGIWEMNLWSLIKLGGPIMVPIIFCSVFALGIVIEKLMYFSYIKTNVLNLKRRVFDHIKNNRIKESIELCNMNNSPVAKILKAGILKFGASREDIKESMEDVSLFEIPKIESRLSALATIAHISPLLGLLGTVTGMTASFHMIQVRAASMNPITPGDLAGGIGEALITTVAGLMVAIPTFVAYNYFVHRTNHVVLEMERVATELVNFICQITETQSKETYK